MSEPAEPYVVRHKADPRVWRCDCGEILGHVQDRGKTVHWTEHYQSRGVASGTDVGICLTCGAWNYWPIAGDGRKKEERDEGLERARGLFSERVAAELRARGYLPQGDALSGSG